MLPGKLLSSTVDCKSIVRDRLTNCFLGLLCSVWEVFSVYLLLQKLVHIVLRLLTRVSWLLRAWSGSGLLVSSSYLGPI